MPKKLAMKKSDPSSSNENAHYVPHKEQFARISPRSPLSTHTPDTDSIDLSIEIAGNSMDQLYNNICEMESSDQSSSSYISYSQESRIDSELRFLARGDFSNIGVKTEEKEQSESVVTDDDNKKTNQPNQSNQSPVVKPSSPAKIPKPISKTKSNTSSKKLGLKSSMKKNEEPKYLAPYLLKQARESMSTGDDPRKALDFAVRAMKTFESIQSEKPDLELVMCLHIVAALYSILGEFDEAIPIVERSIEMTNMNEGQKHSLAKFAGCMQLGDTYAMQGKMDTSILCYTAGLEIQKHVLGGHDARFGETCRYVAEAHIQALQFDEAKKLCEMALQIHGRNGTATSLQEAADRRLMGLICDSKGDYETALEHYVLARMSMSADGHDADVATIDVCIGDAYLSLARYDDAIFSYQTALNAFKVTKGEKNPSVGSVYVRLADLYNKIGKFRESKTYCEHALRIYKPIKKKNRNEEIANGLIEVSGIYESMNELDRALELLKKALKVYGSGPGQLSIVAGVEAQIGVLCYMMGSYEESYHYFKIAIQKYRNAGEKKSGLFGFVLNQMGLASVQIQSFEEAAEYFEEARGILEREYGPQHIVTLGVYSNLAGTYDAIGRWDDAIDILEYVVGMREEKLGTADPEVDNEKRWLAELLKESGRNRRKGSRSLGFLLDG
ncbi:protein KINESIN LIGHT CHAIN-RELATED 2 [Lactuca sativa]|uniref:MalT-like TPR region domain-containing protein n=1 Tax=Lactuca sativa TaxID=4236 RepID=A0A9R1VPR8_LACSA|nr:protein KINESIN LIGHT CHAIN-RELATED 2 [Lactuca sativa]KAJ0211387.1 hypothetical protein LSAT_V11C400226750 [Lactuca sativa]